MSRLDKVFGFWDYVVFIGLLVVSSFIGVFFAWRARLAKNSDHFFTGGRKLGTFPVTLSLVASFMSTNTLLGLPAEVFQIGTQYVMQIIPLCIIIVMAAEVFLPVYYGLGITSVNEYLERRFKSKKVKLAGSIAFLTCTMPYMAVVLYGPAIALASVIQISISTSILVIGVICTFYTSIGGIKAVIWTDVLQCILMFLGVAIVIIQGVLELGGFTAVWEKADAGGRLKLFNLKFDLYNHDNFWNVVFGTAITWGACYCASQTQVQRYLSMRSPAQAKRTLYYNLPGLILLAIMAIFSGMVIYVKYKDCDPVTLGIIERHDQLLPYYVMDTLSHIPGLAGLFVACIFSGSLSTLSSGFNALAAITWEDLLKDRLNISPKASINAVKLIAMCYGVLAIAFSFGVGSLGTVLQASMSISGSLSGPIFGIFFMAVLMRFANGKGAIVGSVTGFLVSLTMSFGSIVIPRPHIAMPTSVNGCSADIIAMYMTEGKVTHVGSQQFIPYYEDPEGIDRIVHISYLIMSTIGFIATILVGTAVSLLTGGLRANRDLDDALLSPYSRFLPPFQVHKPKDERSKGLKAKNGGGYDSGDVLNNNNNHNYDLKSFRDLIDNDIEYIDTDRGGRKG